MKKTVRHKRKSTGSALSALAVAALLASGGALSAQTTFTMPTDICTWDWAGPTTPGLLATLKEQGLLVHTTVEMAKNCPEKLCDIDWEGTAAGNASSSDEMLCELGHRQLFFAPLTETLSGICPDVAQLMTDRLPEVYDSCGTWPRATPGGTGGAPAPKEPDEEEVPEEVIIDNGQPSGGDDEPTCEEDPSFCGPPRQDV